MANIGMDLYLAYEDGYKKGKADAVVHGHWIEAKYPLFTCSECGATYQDTGYGYYFCPNCGANMRVENE